MKKIFEIKLSDLERLVKNNDLSVYEILTLKILREVDIYALKKLFSFISGLEIDSEEFIKFSMKKMEFIAKEGYIKLLNNTDPFNYAILSKLEDLFVEDEPDNNDINVWIEDWRNIFPKGYSPSGYRWRGDKQGCLKKMTSFMKKNPSITKETIFKATEKYVKENKNNTYMKLAHYFIDKEGNSTLLSVVEGLDEVIDNNTSINKML